MKIKPFWIVWNERPGTPNPSHKHASEDLAEMEAERLSRMYGGKFFVMQCVGGAFRVDTNRIEVSDDGVPF